MKTKLPHEHTTLFKVKSHRNYKNSFWDEETNKKVTITPYFPEISDRVAKLFGVKNILDPFCGSGTTLESGLKNKLKVYGIEIDKRIARIALKNCIEVSKKEL